MPPLPMYDGIVSCGTGISCERSVRFELCILTASESVERSAGRAVSSDNLVIVSEQSLEIEIRREGMLILVNRITSAIVS